MPATPFNGQTPPIQSQGKRPAAADFRSDLQLALLHFRVLTRAGPGLATRVLDLHRRELRRCIAHHQNRQRQQQDRSGQVHHAHVRRVVMGDVGDQQAGQGRNRHVNQETYRHVVGLDASCTPISSNFFKVFKNFKNHFSMLSTAPRQSIPVFSTANCKHQTYYACYLLFTMVMIDIGSR